VGRGILHSTNWKSIRERVKKNVELNFIFGWIATDQQN
jgi:hypothetical protein